jgi:hypothetical protein
MWCPRIDGTVVDLGVRDSDEVTQGQVELNCADLNPKGPEHGTLGWSIRGSPTIASSPTRPLTHRAVSFAGHQD